jgi:hypothetical protein
MRDNPIQCPDDLDDFYSRLAGRPIDWFWNEREKKAKVIEARWIKNMEKSHG